MAVELQWSCSVSSEVSRSGPRSIQTSQPTQIGGTGEIHVHTVPGRLGSGPRRGTSGRPGPAAPRDGLGRWTAGGPVGAGIWRPPAAGRRLVESGVAWAAGPAGPARLLPGPACGRRLVFGLFGERGKSGSAATASAGEEARLASGAGGDGDAGVSGEARAASCPGRDGPTSAGRLGRPGPIHYAVGECAGPAPGRTRTPPAAGPYWADGP